MGSVADAQLTLATGTAERHTTVAMLDAIGGENASRSVWIRDAIHKSLSIDCENETLPRILQLTPAIFKAQLISALHGTRATRSVNANESVLRNSLVG